MHTSGLYHLFDDEHHSFIDFPELAERSAPKSGFTFTPFNSIEDALSKQSTVAFWMSFISTGNPSASRKFISSGWLPFSSGSRMVLDQPSNYNLKSASIMGVAPPREVE
ncbi:hypothetical protein ACEPAH_2468 [Sanghuangporus vaninii]